ncbi:hypothetical protein VN97_g2232 [Penicillium thymicola]|uniref:Uncharacterized protein n=1 Tax=Penicillium thymicola TaxID=293382 RepID=A0AAI9TPJ4_PENTH|nr:hypothetical protein VN97_g2232 [Penicillium thymicola]
MKFVEVSALFLACLSTGALAGDATVQLANDKSGANANVAIPTDGNPRSVAHLWGKTPVSKDGVVYASSAQLVAFQHDTSCVIFQRDHYHAELDAQKTWVSLSGGEVVNLNDAFVVCEDE